MEIVYLKEKDRIDKIRYNFENGIISSNDITPDDTLLLSFMYQLEILSLDSRIKEQKEILEGYKVRLKNAIEYLKSKNSEL